MKASLYCSFQGDSCRSVLDHITGQVRCESFLSRAAGRIRIRVEATQILGAAGGCEKLGHESEAQDGR